MLPLPPFRLECPDTIEQLLPLASAPGSRLLAGGTDLLPSLKHRLFQAEVLVSLGRVDALGGIEQREAGLRIGATARLWDVARHPAVCQAYPALAAACRTVATSTIQAMATLGGNVMLDVRCIYFNQPDGWRESIGGCLKCEGDVCHVARTGTGCYAAHSADTVPALWLYGAKVELQSTTIGSLLRTNGVVRQTELKTDFCLTMPERAPSPTPHGTRFPRTDLGRRPLWSELATSRQIGWC